MVKVSVVISATPMVAVSPGSAPMTMPRNVAHTTLNRVSGVMRSMKRGAELADAAEHAVTGPFGMI